MSTPAPSAPAPLAAPGGVPRPPRERIPGRGTGASRVADAPVEVGRDRVVPVRPPRVG